MAELDLHAEAVEENPAHAKKASAVVEKKKARKRSPRKKNDTPVSGQMILEDSSGISNETQSQAPEATNGEDGEDQHVS